MSEYALAAGNSRAPSQLKKETLLERGLVASPSGNNILHPEFYRDALTKTVGAGAKNGPSALVIPDYATRMTVLEFDEFPPGVEDRIALLRFRLRKNVPFPIDEAQLSYTIQHTDAKKVEVLALAMARPILEDYERIFSDAGYRPGMVLPSFMASLPLCPSIASGLTLFAKTTGFTLSVALLSPQRVRLIRCVDLTSGEEVAGLLPERAGAAEGAAMMMKLFQQTVAYAEDQLGSPVTQAILTGFEEQTQHLLDKITGDFGVSASELRSKLARPGVDDAGVLGMLERYAA